VALAHSLLTVIHHMLSTGCEFEDLGADYFNKRDEERIVKSHVRRLQGLGYSEQHWHVWHSVPGLRGARQGSLGHLHSMMTVDRPRGLHSSTDTEI